MKTAGAPWPLLQLNEVPEEPRDPWPWYVGFSGRRSVLGFEFSFQRIDGFTKTRAHPPLGETA